MRTVRLAARPTFADDAGLTRGRSGAVSGWAALAAIEPHLDHADWRTKVLSLTTGGDVAHCGGYRADRAEPVGPGPTRRPQPFPFPCPRCAGRTSTCLVCGNRGRRVPAGSP